MRPRRPAQGRLPTGGGATVSAVQVGPRSKPMNSCTDSTAGSGSCSSRADSCASASSLYLCPSVEQGAIGSPLFNSTIGKCTGFGPGYGNRLGETRNRSRAGIAGQHLRAHPQRDPLRRTGGNGRLSNRRMRRSGAGVSRGLPLGSLCRSSWPRCTRPRCWTRPGEASGLWADRL